MLTRQLIIVRLGLALTLLFVAFGCTPSGSNNVNQPTPTPTPVGKQCSGEVVTSEPVEGASCNSCRQFVGEKITMPCTGPNQTECPLPRTQTRGCPGGGEVVDPKNNCLLTIGNKTACK